MSRNSQQSEASVAKLGLAQLEEGLRQARDKRIVVVGDVMLDEFVAGEVSRISPEAPVQVLAVEKTWYFLGAAGNVANNLAPYCENIELIGITGEDAGREKLRALLDEIGVAADGLIADSGRPTTQKTRFTADGLQLLRADREVKLPPTPQAKQKLLKRLLASVAKADVVIAADYAKGVLDEEVFTALAKACQKNGVPLYVDPKRKDFSFYKGATLIKPNKKEAEAAASRLIDSEKMGEDVALQLLTESEAETIIITMGGSGLLVCEKNAAQVIPTDKREVYDVAGAGDTTLSFLALGRLAGLNLSQAGQLANIGAGITVSKRGVARVEPFELLRAFADKERLGSSFSPPKQIQPDELEKLGQSLRAANKSVVFTNGCFDLIDAGHVQLLQQARSLGDSLVVGLNSDASVARLKGPKRPFLSLDARLGILNAIEAVDYLVVFDEDDPRALIETLQPAVLAKGGNYKPEEVVGADLLAGWGGRLEMLHLHEDEEAASDRLGQEIAEKVSTNDA